MNNMFGFIKKNNIEFDSEEYIQIAGKSEIFRDIIFNKLYSVPLVCVGKTGIYVFIISNYTDEKHLLGVYDDARRSFNFGAGVYTFIRCEDADYYIYNGKPVKVESMLDAFYNLYNNNLLPQTELMQYDFTNELDMLNEHELPEGFKRSSDRRVADKVSANYIRQFKDRIEYIYSLKQKHDNKVIEKDGIRYVKHPITKFGIIVSDSYFPVSEENPWKYMLLTFFGGIFGAHKFKAGDYLGGVIYILTCGLFGIGYLVDMVSIVTGTYFVTQTTYEHEENGYSQNKLRIYLDTLDKKHKLYGVLFIVLGIGMVYLAYRFLYAPILYTISNEIFRFAQIKALY